MAERNVTFLILAKDFASRVMKDIGDNTDRTAQKLRNLNTIGMGPLATAGAALGPALLPIMGAAVIGSAALGTAIAGAGAATGVFGAVVATTFTEVQEASKKSDDLRTKISLLNREIADTTGTKAQEGYIKARDKALIEYRARLAELPGPTRAAVAALDGLKTGWQAFVDSNKPVTLGLMTTALTLLSHTIPVLQPLFNAGAAAASSFLGAISRWATNGGLQGLVLFLANTAGPAFSSFGAIALSLGRGLMSLLGPLIQTTPGVISGIEGMASAFERWAGSAGQAGVRDIIAYVTANGPGMAAALMGIAGSIGTLAQAAAPLAPVSLAIATGLASIIDALPQPVLTAMIGSFIAWSAALQGAMIVARLAAVVSIFAGAVVGLTAAITGETLVENASTAAKVAYAVATGVVTVAQWAWNAALWAGAAAMAILMSPIFLIIAGIALLAAGLYLAWTRSETFRAVVTGAFNAVRGAIAWLGEAFARSWVIIQAWYTNTIAWFQALPGRVMAGIAALPGLWVAYWRFILERGAYYIGFAIGYIIRVAMTLPGRFMAGIRALQGMWSIFWVGIWNRAKSLVLAGSNAVVAFFAALPGRAGAAVAALWGRLAGSFNTAAANARSAASRAVSGAVSFFAQLPGRAASAISSLPSRIMGVFAGAGGWLVSAGGDIVHGLTSGIAGAMGNAIGEAKRIASSIVSGFKAGLGIGSPSRVMADEVGRWIPPGILTGLRSAMPTLLGGVDQAMSSVTDAASVNARSNFDLGIGRSGSSGQALPPYGGGGSTEVLQPIQLIVDGIKLQQVLLKIKRDSGGILLGLA